MTLARALEALATADRQIGNHTAAATANAEAVDLYRELTALNRDAYLPDLAGSVNNLAVYLAEAGRRTEGLAAAQEAVDLRRELTALNRDAHQLSSSTSCTDHVVGHGLGDEPQRQRYLAAGAEAPDEGTEAWRGPQPTTCSTVPKPCGGRSNLPEGT